MLSRVLPRSDLLQSQSPMASAIWEPCNSPTPVIRPLGIVLTKAHNFYRITSYTWKSAWGPNYHPSMFIGIAGIALATVLAFTIRCILVHQNKQLDRQELKLNSSAQHERISEAARLEGITFEEALKRRRGFRFLV